MSNQINISIQGCKGSGKTTILHMIGLFLRSQGYEVQAMDEDRQVELHTVTPRNGRRVIVLSVYEA